MLAGSVLTCRSPASHRKDVMYSRREVTGFGLRVKGLGHAYRRATAWHGWEMDFCLCVCFSVTRQEMDWRHRTYVSCSLNSAEKFRLTLRADTLFHELENEEAELNQMWCICGWRWEVSWHCRIKNSVFGSKEVQFPN